METLQVSVTIPKPVAVIWDAYTNATDIVHWNTAHESWHCPKAELELKVGGAFSYRMEARDGSFGFDFSGTFTEVDEPHRLAYVLNDERKVEIDFLHKDAETLVTIHFQTEDTNPAELQIQGWQGILDNFKHYLNA